MGKRLISSPQVLLVLLTLALAGLALYYHLAPASGEEPAAGASPGAEPTVPEEIEVKTFALDDTGTEQKWLCKADALIVVEGGRVAFVKERTTDLDLRVSDRIPALDAKTGAFFVSRGDDGQLQQGTRDCVEVAR